MRAQLAERLAELKEQYESGRSTLGELEGQLTILRDTLLRISGAIEVLEEELAKPESQAGNGVGPVAIRETEPIDSR
jgi:hypothetical protein